LRFLKRWWSHSSITNKFLIILLSLTLISFAVIGYVSLYLVNGFAAIAGERSVALGEAVAVESTERLEGVVRSSVYQKAHDVAWQVEMYLSVHPELSPEQLHLDEELARITGQTIANTGYISLYEKETAIMRTHPDPSLINFDMSVLAGERPQWWEIFSNSLDGSVSSGYYDWPEADGSVSQLFSYMVPVESTGYMISATANIDELMAPSRDMLEAIIASANETSSYIQQQREAMQLIFGMVVISMLALITLAAYFMARRITQPIKVLTEGSKIFGGGDFDYRVDVRTGDEIEQLASQFNLMAATLKDSYTSLERKVAERTRGEHRRAEQLRGINEVGRRINAVLTVDELLPLAVDTVHRIFGYENVNVLVLESGLDELVLEAGVGGYRQEVPVGLVIRKSEGIVGRVARTGEAALVNDVTKDSDYLFVRELADTRAEMAVPISIGERMLGVLDIQSASTDAFDEIDLDTARTLADSVAIAIENARLYQDIREMTVIGERNRMAREIHDTLAQGLSDIEAGLQKAADLLGGDNKEAKTHIIKMQRQAKKSLEEARRSVWALRPQEMRHWSLLESLENEVKKVSESDSLMATFNVQGDPVELTEEMDTALWRITQEALTNVIRHAAAKLVKVNVTYHDTVVRLSIQDNGRGFDSGVSIEGRSGLIGMEEHARLQDGVLVVRSEVGKGTLVEATIPINRKNRQD
jgi:nitrate/nitrite-specific signal transduction histidine kinase